MMRNEGPEREPDPAADRSLWRRCRGIDAGDSEAVRFLDLAAYADGNLDSDDEERVAEWLTTDPAVAADVRAARVLSGVKHSSTGLERVIARATAILVGAESEVGAVVPFTPRWRRRAAQVAAQWGSLAAAIILTGWLGFAMGSGTLLALSDNRQPADTGLFQELFEPATGLLRDLGEGLRT
jgi:anti-sigma factor RsiW